ncbi:fanconi-associated nuclease 1 homolog isoform X2 [Benincasa hispida]|uniref:fanconi-associated nuclease 1 homolog isoform X2 n=1 Tax=Benincasa hispida TaxID=102211 RepID=UPI001901DE4C|nr:fanconi-associated nuclease 1 homolog isoform X2 [Benincasa hispida]
MLRGRESLVRLVGKRRRFLPNRLAILSSPLESTLNLCSDEHCKPLAVEKNRDAHEHGDIESSASGKYVTCPVCGSRVNGEDSIINSHLDACLSRGRKRKLTQSTLLQLNFCSRSKVQHQSHVLKSEKNESSVGPGDSLMHRNVHKLPKDASHIENDEIICEPLVECSIRPQKDCLLDTLNNCERTNDASEICSPKNKRITSGMVTAKDDLSGMILQTFIVGRKFSDEKELNLGESISLERDPTNVNDPNAIKVISADSECCKMLGFLPRELAQFLSPLIEKYCLNFKGFVTTAPRSSVDVVPIEVMCDNNKLFHENNFDVEEFKNLWTSIQKAIDSTKNFTPNALKYQKNFSLLVQEVLQGYSHLLSDDEKQFLDVFSSLSDDSQRLFIRLYMRKGPWFRMSCTSYKEVLDPKQAVKELSEAGYLCCFATNEADNTDMIQILNLLTVSELREVMCMLKKNCNSSMRKDDLVASLLSPYEDGLCPLLPDLILGIAGLCTRISSKAELLIWRAERLFFLNGEQDLSAFLLVDMGIVKYPTYSCIITDQIFLDRNDLLAYEEAIEVAQLIDQALDEKDNKMVLRCVSVADSRVQPNTCTTSESVAFFSSFSASWIYSKVVSLGVSFLERENRYNDAVLLLKRLLNCYTRDGRRGYWTLRLSIDLEHLGYPSESLSVAERGLLDPWVRAGSRMGLQRRILRLGKPPRRWKIPSFADSIKRKITEVHIQGRPLNCETGMKSRFYGESGEQCSVEQLALEYYSAEGGGWQGVHSESGIWLTIFGLLLWDAIFSDVPNVFRTKFQTAPLDFGTDSFYLLRQNSIESQLQKIQEGMGEEILITSWESHKGTACNGVHWDRHSLAELRAAVTCIGGPCMASLCRHLAQDYQSWSSGMPDLLLWRFNSEYSGEAKLVEVKGPRDRLSEQQRAWLLLLMDCGFITEVCKITPMPKLA